MPPKKNLSRGCLSNWCDADADADISKTICRPPPYGGVDIITLYFSLGCTTANSGGKASEQLVTSIKCALQTDLQFLLLLSANIRYVCLQARCLLAKEIRSESISFTFRGHIAKPAGFFFINSSRNIYNLQC